MYTGTALVNSVWSAIGVVVVFAAVVMIIFKFFLGAQKNIPGGVASLLGVAVLAALAANPAVLLAAGDTIKGLVGL